MTSILFRLYTAKEDSAELGARLKEVCSMPALSNVRLAENNKEKEFYIADLAEGADARAVTKALRGVRGVMDMRQGSCREELEAYVTRYSAMPAMDQISEMILSDPVCTIGYMTARRKTYEARAVKALFNHAAVAQPKDLASAPDDARYSITRAQKASLMYKTSRNAGDGVVRSAGLWLRAHF